MDLTLACAKCWEQKCDHWKIEFKEVKSSMFGGLKCNYNITCQNCSKISEVKIKQVYLPQTFDTWYCGCMNKIIIWFGIVGKDFTLADFKSSMRLHSSNEKIPKAYCDVCSGTGLVSKHEFGSCPNCAATGGTTCTLCNQHGYILSNRRNSAAYCQDTIVTKCTCDNGYKLKCKSCNGEKAVVIGAISSPCKECF